VLLVFYAFLIVAETRAAGDDRPARPSRSSGAYGVVTGIADPEDPNKRLNSIPLATTITRPSRSAQTISAATRGYSLWGDSGASQMYEPRYSPEEVLAEMRSGFNRVTAYRQYCYDRLRSVNLDCAGTIADAFWARTEPVFQELKRQNDEWEQVLRNLSQIENAFENPSDLAWLWEEHQQNRQAEYLLESLLNGTPNGESQRAYRPTVEDKKRQLRTAQLMQDASRFPSSAGMPGSEFTWGPENWAWQIVNFPWTILNPVTAAEGTGVLRVDIGKYTTTHLPGAYLTQERSLVSGDITRGVGGDFGPLFVGAKYMERSPIQYPIALEGGIQAGFSPMLGTIVEGGVSVSYDRSGQSSLSANFGAGLGGAVPGIGTLAETTGVSVTASGYAVTAFTDVGTVVAIKPVNEVLLPPIRGVQAIFTGGRAVRNGTSQVPSTTANISSNAAVWGAD